MEGLMVDPELTGSTWASQFSEACVGSASQEAATVFSWLCVYPGHQNMGPHMHDKCFVHGAISSFFCFLKLFIETESYVGQPGPIAIQPGLDLTV